ncbi:MAG: hypothetical protein UW91_C0016G0024, partial [Parcubacteria group bacterium GW2011_GWF2_45_11]
VNVARYRAENPEKYRAHGAVNNAIRDGKLDRQPCEVCGVGDGVHAHHDDYSRPLDVRFFCPVHHAERHPEIMNILQWGVPDLFLFYPYQCINTLSCYKHN